MVEELLSALKIQDANIQAFGSASGVILYKLTSPTTNLFIKVGDSTLINGEYRSLEAINQSVPGLSPKPFSCKKLSNGRYFSAVEYLQFGGKPSESLAGPLAQLHTTPAPGGKFGFPVPTCCGETEQPNDYEDTWANFFAKHRLLAILKAIETQKRDPELSQIVNAVVDIVIPKLLGKLDIKPVVLHGDLWAGNAGVAIRNGKSSNIIFDPASCYGHSEFDLGIMRMFGGFNFMKEYHSIVPKTEPAKEYNDRIDLYESYHHLNHYSLGWTSYRRSGLQMLSRLVDKYGS